MRMLPLSSQVRGESPQPAAGSWDWGESPGGNPSWDLEVVRSHFQSAV